MSSNQLFLHLADHGLGQSHINSQDTYDRCLLNHLQMNHLRDSMKFQHLRNPNGHLQSTYLTATKVGFGVSSSYYDNVHIVSGSDDGTMRKWDCETGLLVGESWKGEGGGISALHRKERR